MTGAHHRVRGLPAVFARWIVVAGIVLGLAQPRDRVWCQAGSGHSAVEDLDAGCCRAPGGETSCAQDPAASDSRDLDRKQGTDGNGCTDVLVEAPTRLPPAKRISSQQATPLVFPSMDGPFPIRAGFHSRKRGDRFPATAHALSPSSVLRI